MMTDDSRAIGAYLRGLREFSRATLLEGGRELGLSCATMSNRELGFGKFSEEQVAKLEKFYNARIMARLERITESL
jgi:transcriptional regulator with XRE-family HTH domain